MKKRLDLSDDDIVQEIFETIRTLFVTTWPITTPYKLHMLKESKSVLETCPKELLPRLLRKIKEELNITIGFGDMPQ